jgi:hypothetical protein
MAVTDCIQTDGGTWSTLDKCAIFTHHTTLVQVPSPYAHTRIHVVCQPRARVRCVSALFTVCTWLDISFNNGARALCIFANLLYDFEMYIT